MSNADGGVDDQKVHTIRNAKRLKTQHGDVLGVELDFKVKDEQWNEYALLDGGTVRIKVTPIRIMALKNPDGSPVLSVQGIQELYVESQIIVAPLKEG